MTPLSHTKLKISRLKIMLSRMQAMGLGVLYRTSRRKVLVQEKSQDVGIVTQYYGKFPHSESLYLVMKIIKF